MKSNTLRRLAAATCAVACLAGSSAASAHGHYHRGWWGPALGVGLVVGSAAWATHYYNPPPPPTVVVMPPNVPVAAYPAAPNVWYFCADTDSYYPQTPTCPSGWRVVPAQPMRPPGY